MAPNLTESPLQPTLQHTISENIDQGYFPQDAAIILVVENGSPAQNASAALPEVAEGVFGSRF